MSSEFVSALDTGAITVSQQHLHECDFSSRKFWLLIPEVWPSLSRNCPGATLALLHRSHAC